MKSEIVEKNTDYFYLDGKEFGQDYTEVKEAYQVIVEEKVSFFIYKHPQNSPNTLSRDTIVYLIENRLIDVELPTIQAKTKTTYYYAGIPHETEEDAIIRREDYNRCRLSNTGLRLSQEFDITHNLGKRIMNYLFVSGWYKDFLI